MASVLRGVLDKWRVARFVYVLLSLLTLLAMGTRLSADVEVAADMSSASVTAESLVTQLGDDQFAIRERATDQLVQLGPMAIPALEQGLTAADRETRFRSRYALQIVHAMDFRRRLVAFATGNDSGESYALPGWEQFQEQIDDGRDARRLFVQMQKQERELLRVLIESPGELGEAILVRVGELRQSVSLSPQQTQVPVGTTAALLFAANNCTTQLPREAAEYLSSYLRGTSFSQAMKTGAERELLRKMLGTWIDRGQSWSAFQGMLLALQYDLPEGLAAANRVLQHTPGQQAEPLIRSYALLTIAKFGDASNLELVESLLNDKTPFGAAIPINGNVKFQTQIRDVALATAVRLSNQDYARFGFDRLRPHSFYVFNTSTIGFENDTKRAAAIKKWASYRSKE